MNYGLYDRQDQIPVCYCLRCQGEIYHGNTCYPINGWQVLCQECYDESTEHSGQFWYAGTDIEGMQIEEKTELVDIKIIASDEIFEGELLFASPYDEVITPSKKPGDAGYDIYAHFSEEYIVIEPHTCKMIPTDLYTAFNQKYVMELWERGSTGTKNIGQRCGVIDSTYRGAIFVPLSNLNEKPILITKETNESVLEALKEDYILYPYSKAICQALMAYVPEMETHRVSMDVYTAYNTDRGAGALGSSGK